MLSHSKNPQFLSHLV